MVAVKVTEGRKESSKEISRLLAVEAKGTGLWVGFEFLL